MHELSMLMGRLLERSEAMMERLVTIDQRLQAGDARMDAIAERLAAIEAARPDGLPAAERLIKAALPYGIGLATLIATGSHEAAVRIIAAIGTGR